ncbi:hypothetical protein [Micromonospora sp. NPDC005367]|uniref:hypothetical protein n=1 Tax=Micromonospora sp. NPDC005367 TaxID=3155590 RepID=UPI0033B2309A
MQVRPGFDIDWERGRLLLPVLADTADALDGLKIVDGELRYHEPSSGRCTRRSTGCTTTRSCAPS